MPPSDPALLWAQAADVVAQKSIEKGAGNYACTAVPVFPLSRVTLSPFSPVSPRSEGTEVTRHLFFVGPRYAGKTTLQLKHFGKARMAPRFRVLAPYSG